MFLEGGINGRRRADPCIPQYCTVVQIRWSSSVHVHGYPVIRQTLLTLWMPVSNSYYEIIQDYSGIWYITLVAPYLLRG